MSPESPTNEDSSESEGSAAVERWVNGVMLYPTIPIVVGACCLVWNAAWIPADSEFGARAFKVNGPQANAIGIACLSAGAFLHFRFFWSLHPAFPAIGKIGEIISLMVLNACLLFTFFSFWIAM